MTQIPLPQVETERVVVGVIEVMEVSNPLPMVLIREILLEILEVARVCTLNLWYGQNLQL